MDRKMIFVPVQSTRNIYECNFFLSDYSGIEMIMIKIILKDYQFCLSKVFLVFVFRIGNRILCVNIPTLGNY